MASCSIINSNGYSLPTNFGSFFIPPDHLSITEAQDYCESNKNIAVAVLRKKLILKEVQTFIDKCSTAYHPYFVGLTVNNGNGKWLDGSDYNSTIDSILFGKESFEFEKNKGCQNAAIVPNQTYLQLLTCGKGKFFCDENRSAISSTTNLFQTSAVPESTTELSKIIPSEENSTELYAIGGTIIALVLLLILVIVFKRILCKKAGDSSIPMTTNQVFDGTSEYGMKVNDVYSIRNRDDTLPQPKIRNTYTPDPLLESEKNVIEENSESVNFYCTILDPADKT